MDFTPLAGTIRVPLSDPQVKEQLAEIDGKTGVFVPLFVMSNDFGKYSGQRALSLPHELMIAGDGWLTSIHWIPESLVTLDPDRII